MKCRMKGHFTRTNVHCLLGQNNIQGNIDIKGTCLFDNAKLLPIDIENEGGKTH